VSPYRESYRKAIETSYEGFSVDYHNPNDVDHSTFDHDKIEDSMDIMNQHGYFRTDVTQPFGLGTKLAKTYVTRCLLGEEGTTYKYLGLRLFAHPWTVNPKHRIDPSLKEAVETIAKLNTSLTERTRHHLDVLKEKRSKRNDATPGSPLWHVKGRAKFDVTLINRMTYSSDLKKEPTIGQDKCTVSWHADSSLEHYSSIAVYTLLCNESKLDDHRSQYSNTEVTLSNKWSIALRVDHDSEGT
jgi:alpha-ketoglutarate-dependent dioxygenase FTO